ncbi:MAG: class I SAM-dependent methyltransferase, partial [Candidatus Omnitrophota bacterium]
GNSIKYFKMNDPGIRWIGVDIKSSVELNLRIWKNAEFITFDGVNLPFEDESIDLVFCSQVFEHVKYPRKLLKEIRRVLVPGGYFVGSASHLEPYHSLSLWNYTPYGFKILIEESGMKLKEIRPGIDALTLIVRRFFRGSKVFSRYWKKESPLNRLINFTGFITRKKHDEINLIKLLFCGQFVFLVEKN